MGKRDKEHRKKVQKRNERLLNEQKLMEKQYKQMLEQRLALIKERLASMSGNSENDITID